MPAIFHEPRSTAGIGLPLSEQAFLDDLLRDMRDGRHEQEHEPTMTMPPPTSRSASIGARRLPSSRPAIAALM